MRPKRIQMKNLLATIFGLMILGLPFRRRDDGRVFIPPATGGRKAFCADCNGVREITTAGRCWNCGSAGVGISLQ